MDKIMKVSARLKGVFGVLAFLPLPVALVLWAFAQFPERTLFGLPLIGGPIGYAGFSNANFPILGEVTPLMRLCGFLVTLPLAILQVYWMWQTQAIVWLLCSRENLYNQYNSLYSSHCPGFFSHTHRFYLS